MEIVEVPVVVAIFGGRPDRKRDHCGGTKSNCSIRLNRASHVNNLELWIGFKRLRVCTYVSTDQVFGHDKIAFH